MQRGAAWYALPEFAGIQHEMIAKFPTAQLEGLAFFGHSPDQRDLLSYMLGNFLDGARRAQDAVIHSLNRGLRISLPASMADLVKQLRILLPIKA